METPEYGREKAARYLSSCEEYTHEWEKEHVINDWMKKGAVAEKVVGDFKRRAGEVKNKTVLDVGCGNGTYMTAFGQAGAAISGLEVNPTLVELAQQTLDSQGVKGSAVLYDGFTFPFSDASFDFVFSVSTLEHVSDHRAVLNEMARVLKPGGKAYISYPNRWRPLETHTGIWFLSYLPIPVAKHILRMRGRNTIDEINLSFLSYWSLKKYLRGVPLQIVYEYDAGSALRRGMKKAMAAFGIHFSAILGTVMVILEKTEHGKRTK